MYAWWWSGAKRHSENVTGQEEWQAYVNADENRLTPHASRLSVFLAVASLAAILSASASLSPVYAASGPKCNFSAYSLNTGGSACMKIPFVQSAQEKAILKQKQALADEYAAVRVGKVSASQYQKDLQAFMAAHGGATRSNAIPVNNVPAGVVLPNCVIDPNTGQCASFRSLSLTQQPQTKTYYCGPATASEILGVRGVSKSQATLAGTSYLHTDQNGQTNFGDMAPALNTATGSTFYAAVPGSADGMNGKTITITTWENVLLTDINSGWALGGNTVEHGTDSIRLLGHPQDLSSQQFKGFIYHWIAIYGYSSAGGSTWYADSISGDANLFGTWANNVPRYSAYDSGNMIMLLNRRGYIW